jgi:hypothetical protein
VSLTDLERAVAELADVVAKRAQLISRRDKLIVEALESGATWAEVQKATNMGPRAIQLAIRRVKESDPTT